ncbi:MULTISPECIES: hypothetical protein [Amycolatopsis]|uniref:PPE family domain-containing protein n=1 Tax=Amycolatopsis thermalba TaxID=944492 RepID=A0ABY4P5P2_9PSEU|nr:MULTISPECIES: hypothetical protein [Amycolatopsis]OXM72178.1 hypothetical protein CF166_16560 [Amycolatopsis sp. KNN50.9b]UQS27639.1 hypothetical protein L1857_34990 [Amycolatopsis thermalba]
MTSPSSEPRGEAVQLGDNGESAALVQQARNSAGGFTYGGDRAIGSPPNWASQESNQLYLGATQNNDPATAEATGRQWQSHGESLHQAADDLYNAITELGNAWIGQGAGSAQGALVGIANSSKQAGDAAHTMSHRMAQQAAAAAEVKKMPAPKEFDPAKQTAAMLAGGPAAMVADMKVQADEARAVHAQQVQYFNAYTQAMSEVDSATPSFGPESLGLPADGRFGSTSAQSVGAGSGAVPGGLGSVGIGPVGGVTAGLPGGGTGAFAAGGQPGGAPGPHGVPAPPAQAPGAVSGAGQAAAPTSSGGGGSAALGAAVGLGAAGLAAVGGKAALGRGSKSGAKERPAGDETAASSDQSQQAHGAAQQQAQQSLMSTSGTIGGAGTPPPASGMGGGMGAGGAQGAEDEEHTRASFLVEADPDEAFGANVATAPPVIGAWNDEDDR